MSDIFYIKTMRLVVYNPHFAIIIIHKKHVIKEIGIKSPMREMTNDNDSVSYVFHCN